MRTWTVLLLLLPGAVSSSEPSVHKCIAVDGSAVYQSMPCTDGPAVATWAFVAPPAASPTVQTSVPPRPRVRLPPRRVERSEERGRATPADRDQHARCMAASSARDRTLARLGMKRRYDDISRLNDRVSAACNHRGAR